MPEREGRNASPSFHRMVASLGIERHGASVSRVTYLRATTDAGPRLILVYLTADGQVTDQDVVSE